MGRGHSGSTILDVILGNNAEIESIGELASGLMLEQRDGHICACGEDMATCAFWRRARAAFARHPFVQRAGLSWPEAARTLVTHAHIRNLPRTLLAHPGSPTLGRIASISKAFEAALVEGSGKPHIVNSSKEPTRAIMLLRTSSEARAVHLVREPRRLMASIYWRFNSLDDGHMKFLRRRYRARSMFVPLMALAAVSWNLGNLICELAARLAPGQVVRVRYEDLCATPAAELDRIARILSVPLDDVIAKVTNGETLSIGHNVGGNQIRTEGTVVFLPKKGQERDIPRWLSYLTLACCWPLMLAYGYSLRSSAPPPLVTTEAGPAGR